MHIGVYNQMEMKFIWSNSNFDQVYRFLLSPLVHVPRAFARLFNGIVAINIFTSGQKMHTERVYNCEKNPLIFFSKVVKQ